MAKKKNRNWYKAGKFKNVSWTAKVENDETKELATLTYAKNFFDYALNLKNQRTALKKELNNVSKQINKIKKDSKTGEMLKKGLTQHLKAYDTARENFLKAYTALYNGAINTHNELMDDFYTSMRGDKNTDVGSEAKVQAENLGNDNEGTDE